MTTRADDVCEMSKGEGGSGQLKCIIAELVIHRADASVADCRQRVGTTETPRVADEPTHR